MQSECFLITGACGLIGSGVVRRLNALGHTNILIVDKLGSSPHKWRTLSKLKFADYVEADDFAKDEFAYGRKHLDDMGVDTIIHCGACSATTQTDAAFLMRNNLLYSQALAQLAERGDMRFVYASSAATYGADPSMNDTGDLDYLESLRPLNPYGYSKALFDLWMTRNGAFDPSGILNRGGGAVGLKYTNVFGPNEHHKGNQRSVVAKAYDSLKAGQPITLFESARDDIPTDQIKRDFISVDDAARITVWFALDPQGRKQSGLFNVGSGVATSFVSLADYVAASYLDAWAEDRLVGLPRPYVRYVSMPEELRRRYQYFTCASIAKLRAAGYAEPITPLKDAIRDYVRILARGEAQ